GQVIFSSRWLQLPIYLGLIVVQGVYAWKFLAQLWELLEGLDHLTETDIMLAVLGLIDVVMIANLLIMVVVGGYETFVSKIDSLNSHEDRPEWLSHVNAGVLKTKLSLALISISSIHLLKTFISASNLGSPGNPLTEQGVMWQVVIHCTFLLSALVMAWTDKLMQSKH
ncbi:TIGR00645 family protein, partial [Pseudomonas sp. MWU13-2860]